MQDTEHRSNLKAPPPPRRTGMIALVAVVIVAAVGAGTWLTLQDGEQTPTDVVQDLAKAIRNDDMALLNEVSGGADNWFLEWLTALQAEPEFSNCTETAVGPATQVFCDVSFGEGHFYSRVLDEQLTSRIGGTVDADGVFVGSSFPPSPGLTDVEADLRAWVRETRPELEEQLYGSPGYLGIKMTRESGELRMELLDQFMASR